MLSLPYLLLVFSMLHLSHPTTVAGVVWIVLRSFAGVSGRMRVMCVEQVHRELRIDLPKRWRLRDCWFQSMVMEGGFEGIALDNCDPPPLQFRPYPAPRLVPTL